MASREDAEGALYDAIISNAKEAKKAEKAAAAGALKDLTEAFSNVAHGPQGGDKRGMSDYHETHHRDDSREPPGFADEWPA